ncbi:LPXTG cell wall anchor domain-containing protein [Enterococcus termitis]|uniref:Gram-positive cocci surface proteins LPxTG domain-containing protein n=1 Tax=Enterococcus termitis TaxID=332950 RepID=A0A1E5GAW2_9ENTE|nr:LPXTG cell wall anchor domain-containing protein [Enterococcus termitis]OEG09844.1 hypothetical protein BCR25_10090 [Enterococcus termitis]
MQKNSKRRCQYLCVLLYLILALLVKAAPVEGVALPPGVVIGDTDGFYASSEGEYFIELDDLLPGDTFTKEISIRNVDVKQGFDVRLQVKDGEQKGPIDFRKYVTVTIKQGNTVIYEGNILGKENFDWTVSQLPLGFYTSGDEEVLTATFTVSSELGLEDYKEASEYKFYWNFLATAKDEPTTPTDSTDPTTPTTPIKPTKPVKPSGFLPSTGEEWENLLYRICAGLFLIVIALFFFYKKRRETKK